MATSISRPRKRYTLALVAVLTISGAGVAFAYWTSTGSGTGEAQTGTSVDFTVTSEDAVGTIVPGGVGQTVEFTVTNPGTGAQWLTSTTVALADAAGLPWLPLGGCQAADYSATITSPPAPGSIAAGGSVTGTATVTLADTDENQDACKGLDVPLYFLAS